MSNFNKGDKLKVKLDEVCRQYDGCKGTTVYNLMIEAAEKYTFEVIDSNNGAYTLKRNDGQIDTKSHEEVHRLLERLQE